MRRSYWWHDWGQDLAWTFCYVAACGLVAGVVVLAAVIA